ncbi:MAG: hypothetical protein IH944_09785 [Armatimonadetes bacterium]|nr:hypothetical protein [Armatimonadota bacterium]
MDANEFRDMSLMAFRLDDPPAEIVSDLGREVNPDSEAMNGVLSEKPWSMVPSDALERNAKNIASMTVPAFTYFLPAFMCAALRQPDGECATYSMYALCPLASFDTFYKTTCLLFTPEQAGVVAKFLLELQHDPSFTLFDEEIQPALELWHKRSMGG